MAGNQDRRAVEDYLKVIFSLGEWDTDARSNANIAASLAVSTSSVSEMIRRLVGMGLVDHEPYGPVALTTRGRAVAVEMVRRHRIVETYLVGALGYSWDEVHQEAEVLEHAVTPLLIERMDRVLGRPWRDPHGDPIPAADGVVHQPAARPLARLGVGEVGYIARIGDEDPALLRWFADRGVVLDAQVRVAELRPFGGPLVVQLATGDRSAPVELGFQAVGALWVVGQRPRSSGSRGTGCPYPHCHHVA